jgi:hypothetical protein
MNRIVERSFAVTLLLGVVLSYAAAQAAPTGPPPLVPCEDAAAGSPCITIVTEVGDILGMWRRYYAGASSMGFTEYRDDGTFTILTSLRAETHGVGTISFEGGVAAIAASASGTAPPECKAAALYELRLIRLGEQPVALGYSLVGEDHCMPRVGDLSRPMIFYPGSGEEPVMNPDVAALAQPLVPCAEAADEAYPCDVVVTAAEDAVGIWKQYVTRPDLQAPGEMGYQRINHDGGFILADSPENTATPYENYPFGTMAFASGEVVLTVDAPGVPPMCQTATVRLHVYRYGAQPVALLYAPIEDDCPPRLHDTRWPMIWTAAGD